MNKLIEIDGLLKVDPTIQKNHADDNMVISFKGRTVDTDRPIQVYRNLNRKGKWYSVKQDGLVVGHTTAICIRNPEFIVKGSGKSRAIKTMQRNVHAFIQGNYATSGMGVTAKGKDLPAKIEYLPFNNLRFFCANLTDKKFEVSGAQFCIVNERGVSAAYLYKF